MAKVVVYGTLQKGHGNHYCLHGCKYLGDTLVRGYKLYVARGGYFPVARKTPEGEPVSFVKGELYEIPESIEDYTIGRLDRLESNGNMYDRTYFNEKLGDFYMYVGCDHYWEWDELEECRKTGNVYEW